MKTPELVTGLALLKGPCYATALSVTTVYDMSRKN
jgi:hypothetical protein